MGFEGIVVEGITIVVPYANRERGKAHVIRTTVIIEPARLRLENYTGI